MDRFETARRRLAVLVTATAAALALAALGLPVVGSTRAAAAATNTAITPGALTLNNSQENASSVTYTIPFTTATALTTSSSISLVAPNGTTFPTPSCTAPISTCSNYTVSYGSTSVFVQSVQVAAAAGIGSTTTSPTNNYVVISLGYLILYPVDIPARTAIKVTITGVGNPVKAASANYMAERTSADLGIVLAPPYAINPGPPTQLVAAAGTPQSTVVGTNFPTRLRAVAEDVDNNPVAGVRVSFVVVPGGGATASFAGGLGETDVTDASGAATSSVLRAGSVAGAFSAHANFSPTSGPVAVFGLTNLAGAPTTLSVISGSGQSASVTGAFGSALTAALTDAFANPVPGASVTFSAPGSGPSATFHSTGTATETVQTDSAGHAVSSIPTANQIAGGYQVQAMAASLSRTFTLINSAGSAEQLTATTGNGQHANTGTYFASTLQVKVTDHYGNPVLGVPVTFTAPGSGASGVFVGTQSSQASETDGSDTQGLATASHFLANGSAGGYSVTAAASGLPAATFTLTNDTGVAHALSLIGGTQQQAHVGRRFGSPISVRVLDAGGKPVAGSAVTFAFVAAANGAGARFLSGPTVPPTATVNTDAYGDAISPAFFADAVPGEFSVSVTANGVSGLNLPLTNTEGYYLAGSDGSIQTFGDATMYGSMVGTPLAAPVVGMAAAPGGGYWMVASDGGIFSFGPGAHYYGSMGGQHLDAPIVGMAATPTGGYWMVAADGGIFTFGPEATFYGSKGGQYLAAPIVGMAATPHGDGYYLFAADGGVFTFGPGTSFHGSKGGQHLDAPIVGGASSYDGQGYYLVAGDGGVFTFGSARFFGSVGGQPLVAGMVGMATAAGGLGYWFVAHDGGVFAEGPEAAFYGAASSTGEPVVAVAEA